MRVFLRLRDDLSRSLCKSDGDKLVHPEAEHHLKRNKPTRGMRHPAPNINSTPLDQFFSDSFPSFCKLFAFEMAISYTKEDLRKAAAEAQRTRQLRQVGHPTHHSSLPSQWCPPSFGCPRRSATAFYRSGGPFGQLDTDSTSRWVPSYSYADPGSGRPCDQPTW